VIFITVQNLCNNCGFEPLNIPFPNREIKGGYCGDLLSWVMGRAGEDNAWITIMSNINVIAVATLADVSCVIFSEGTRPDDEVLSVAKEKEVNLIVSPLNTYDTAVKISGYINE